MSQFKVISKTLKVINCQRQKLEIASVKIRTFAKKKLNFNFFHNKMLTLVSDVWSSRFKALNRSESVEKIKFKIVSIEIAKENAKKWSQIYSLIKINGSRVNCDNRDCDNQKIKKYFLTFSKLCKMGSRCRIYTF